MTEIVSAESCLKDYGTMTAILTEAYHGDVDDKKCLDRRVRAKDRRKRKDFLRNLSSKPLPPSAFV